MTDSIVPNPPLVQQFAQLDAQERAEIWNILLGTAAAINGTPLALDTDNVISWQPVAGGGVLAKVSSGPSGGLTVDTTGSGNQNLVLEAANGAALAIRPNSSTTTADVIAFAGAQDVTILTGQLQSSFAQVNGQTNRLCFDVGLCNMVFLGANSSTGTAVFPNLPAGAAAGAYGMVVCSANGVGINCQGLLDSVSPVEFTVFGDYPFGTLTANQEAMWIAWMKQ